MATPGIGYKSYVQMGLESTYGQEVNATRRLEIISFNCKPGIAHIRDTSMPGTRSIKNRSRTRPAHEFTIKQRMDYTGMLMLIDAIMGTSTYGSVGGVTTGSNPYAHVWTMLSLFNSYTLEFIEGQPSNNSGAISLLTGAKFNNLTLSCQRGSGEDAMLIAEWGGIAQTYDEAATATGALSAPTYNPILFKELSTVDVGHADAAALTRLKSFSLSIDNSLSKDREYGGSAGLIDEPIVDGFASVKWSFTNEYRSTTALSAALAMTSGSPKMVFGSTSSKRVTLESGTAYITDYGHPTNGPGIIEQTFEWEADYNTSDTSALKVTVEDTAATIT